MSSESHVIARPSVVLAQPAKPPLWRRMWRARQAYFFLAPLFAGLIVFCYYPPLNGLYHSFFDWDSIGRATFVGLDNFRELFRDRIFLSSIPTMGKLMIPRLAIQVIVPLIMAELIFAVRNGRLQYAYRVLVLLPMVAPGVVLVLIWKYIYDPNNGLAVALFRLLGLLSDGEIIDWLGDPRVVIKSIIFMGFPWIGGTAVLIYTSGLMGIPTQVIESSILDGASVIRRIFSIDLPMIIGQIRYFLVFGIIVGLQDYGVQVILTRGGPGYTTYVPGYYMYTQAFFGGRMGYASAIGALLFVAIMALTLLTFKYIRPKSY